jgi:hypothetical protein
MLETFVKGSRESFLMFFIGLDIFILTRNVVEKQVSDELNLVLGRIFYTKRGIIY